MATPMTPTQIVSQLKKWGISYEEYKDWETHNRNHKGSWGPVNGFMVHHTGSDSKDQRAMLYNGYADLPGPLCHFGLAQDGTVHLIGWGRANHAGAGDPDVLNAVIAEKAIPKHNESTVDFNSRFYGVEIWYSGSHEMTEAQYSTLLKLSAAVLDFHGWSEGSVIGHGESGSPGKWDPGFKSGQMMNMNSVRKDVGGVLRGKASTPSKPAPAPTKPKPVSYEPYPGAAYFKKAPKSSLVERMGKRLKAEGCSAYQVGPGPQWTEADRKSYRKWQLKLGYRGTDADGWPGKASWDKLKVPKA
ncbi:peptidoglycan-binding protein [Streptomyces halstedii]|uniref:peptidoglycan-binding protein n=1 Tax=Streptomyces halstedii TaxID=1944 RepID=UPI003827E23D